MLQILEYLKARTASDEHGAAAVEYALLIALIAAAIAGTVSLLSGSIISAFNSVKF